MVLFTTVSPVSGIVQKQNQNRTNKSKPTTLALMTVRYMDIISINAIEL